MFTGIVEGKRQLIVAEPSRGGVSLVLDLGDLAHGVRVGDSISVRGCCLTIEALAGTRATFHLMAETLRLTLFANAERGHLVNVERSLRVGDRLGGHFVSGHVDGIGRVVSVAPTASQTEITIEVPGSLAELVIPKGSIAIDGVSLTIAALRGNLVTVSLIPHTLEVTTLGTLGAGDGAHLEMDMIGKWVKRLLPGGTVGDSPPSLPPI